MSNRKWLPLCGGMARMVLALFLLGTLLALGAPPVPSSAQADQISVAINGEPAVEGSRVSLLVSVTKPGGVIGDLTADAFAVTEAGQPVTDLSVQPAASGLAVVLLVDRGGIATLNGCQGPTGSIRVTEAKELARSLIDQLVVENVPGSPDDMMALIGIGDEGDDGRTQFWPDQDFSFNPVDRNLVLNALEPLDAPENLFGAGVTTPLYEGLDRALGWLTQNSNPTIRDELARRHKLILVFSDGIDRDYSDDARELGIIDTARKSDINIYSVGMGCPASPGLLVPASMQHLATQTGGLYWPHDSVEAHGLTVEQMAMLLGYRQQYKVSFTTQQGRGEYTVRVRVTTAEGADDAETRFISSLQAPSAAIESPGSGYELDEAAAAGTVLPVTVAATFPDGVARDLEVEFRVDGASVHTLTGVPPYTYDWDLATLAPGRHILAVRVTDPLLGGAPIEMEREIEILASTPTPTITPVPTVTPTPKPVEVIAEAGQDWLPWLVIPLGIVVIALLILLLRTRRQVTTVVQQGVKRVTTNLTRVLSPSRAPARAKLTVTRGRHRNHEYRLSDQVTRFGRVQDLCDEVIDDPSVSGHHFSITYDAAGTSFFVMDHGSRNGTYVNNQPQPIPANQYVPLAFGNTVRVGDTEMVFQRIGGTTRMLR